MKIRNLTNRRAAVLFGVAVISLFVAGCGDDKPAGSETGKGATAGATGEEAGGSAVEAGKIREPKEVEAEKRNFSEEPPPVQILVGSTTGYYVKKPTVEVAQSKAQMRAMLKKHFDHGIKRQDVAPIDFKERQIVGLFLPKSEKGSQLSITDIHQEGDVIVVRAVKLLKGKGCSAASERPRLFHVVETRKMKHTDTQAKIESQPTMACD